MKKIIILTLFLSIFTFSFVFFSDSAHASGNATEMFVELSGGTESQQIVNASTAQTKTYTLEQSYDSFADTTIVATLNNNGYEGLNARPLSYQWYKSGVAITGEMGGNPNTLKILKSKTNITDNSVFIGLNQYSVTIEYADDNNTTTMVFTCYFNLTVTESGNVYQCLVCSDKTDWSTTPINKNSDTITFLAEIPVSSSYTINWYLKTANIVNYNLIGANKTTFQFNPSEIITDETGYGNYRLIAIAISGDNTYISEPINLIIESLPYTITAKCKILHNTATNSKSNVQAFDLTLTNSTSLDNSKIIWTVNNSKVGIGKVYKFEPNVSSTYKIVANYYSDGTLIEIDAVTLEAHATGTIQLLWYILGAVAFMSIILVISIKVTNKKRDVIW